MGDYLFNRGRNKEPIGLELLVDQDDFNGRALLHYVYRDLALTLR